MAQNIRRAVEVDIPDLVEMGRKFHAKSPYREAVPFDEASIRILIGNLLSNDDGVIVRSDTGVISGIVMPHFMNVGVRFAVELMWYSEGRDGLKLLSAFEEWARSRGAQFIAMIGLANENEQMISTLYKRRGYSLAEQNFWKEV